MSKKYEQLVKVVEEERNARLKAESLRDESRSLDKQFEKALKEQIDILSSQIEKSTGDSQSAKRTADSLALELTRIRRLMQAAGRANDEAGETT